MRTYWDLAPRDIWNLVLEYVIPRVDPDVKWHKMDITGSIRAYTNGDSTFARTARLQVLAAWLEEKIEHPLEYLTNYYLGPGELPLSWDFLALANQLTTLQMKSNSVNKLMVAIQLGRFSLYDHYYSLWREALEKKPQASILKKSEFASNPLMLGIRNSVFESILEQKVAEQVFETNNLTVWSWAEEKCLRSLRLFLVGRVGFSHCSDVVIHRMIQLMTEYPMFLAKLFEQCLRLDRAYLLEELNPTLTFSFETAHYLVAKKNLPLPFLEQVCSQVRTENELESEDWHRMVRWHLELSSEDQSKYVFWLAVFDRCSRASPTFTQEVIHRLLMVAISSQDLFWIECLYRHFFRVFDRPQLFYSSYSFLRRHDLLPLCSDFLPSLYQEALSQGLIRTTRKFP